MNKIECEVIVEVIEGKSNLVLSEDETLHWFGLNHIIDEYKCVVIYLRNKNGYVIATSDRNDAYPQIGMDFIWTYIEDKTHSNRVYVKVSEDYPTDYKKLYTVQSLKDLPNTHLCKNVLLHKNGDVIISRCDEKKYTEKDVITMLSYAVAHDKINSKEMKERVDEILNWFNSNI